MDNKSAQNYLPPDIDDVRIWQLYILIGQKRIIAEFYNSQSKEIYTYLDYKSEQREPISLNKIQSLIYENTLMLNDYQTTILLESHQFTVVPSEFVRNEEAAYDMMESVCSIDNADLWINRLGEETILFTTAEGVQSFIYRTFPTAKALFPTSCLITYFKEDSSVEKRNDMIVNIAETDVEIIVVSGGSIKFANIFTVNEESDIIYYTLNVWNMLGLDQESDRLKIYGTREVRNRIMPSLRKYVNYVMLPILPARVTATTGVPINLQLAIYLNNKQ